MHSQCTLAARTLYSPIARHSSRSIPDTVNVLSVSDAHRNTLLLVSPQIHVFHHPSHNPNATKFRKRRQSIRPNLIFSEGQSCPQGGISHGQPFTSSSILQLTLTLLSAVSLAKSLSCLPIMLFSISPPKILPSPFLFQNSTLHPSSIYPSSQTASISHVLPRFPLALRSAPS
ncbi:hypothetical protein P154DRAFT_24654 [Amniculicola lignicola CBS 123094]|uniref:Uncharacterized protein n=1 Tax=Amniculicola lignicola CBS 123094 TaxID=1392246 RepID=A0A6A5WXW8_9PLEO|nr:hypothetical protein P154DRAFT_24654 [Amniculicola lignicola CBS 123094]